MHTLTGSQQFEVKIKSPVGWVKAHVGLEMDTENSFHGTAKLMGLNVPYEKGRTDGSHYRFDIAVKLPFGELPVSIRADLHEDGSVTGFADAPKHKPMKIEGAKI